MELDFEASIFWGDSERCQRRDRARENELELPGEEKGQAHFQCGRVKNNVHKIARGC